MEFWKWKWLFKKAVMKRRRFLCGFEGTEVTGCAALLCLCPQLCQISHPSLPWPPRAHFGSIQVPSSTSSRVEAELALAGWRAVTSIPPVWQGSAATALLLPKSQIPPGPSPLLHPGLPLPCPLPVTGAEAPCWACAIGPWHRASQRLEIQKETPTPAGEHSWTGGHGDTSAGQPLEHCDTLPWRGAGASTQGFHCRQIFSAASPLSFYLSSFQLAQK